MLLLILACGTAEKDSATPHLKQAVSAQINYLSAPPNGQHSIRPEINDAASTALLGALTDCQPNLAASASCNAYNALDAAKQKLVAFMFIPSPSICIEARSFLLLAIVNLEKMAALLEGCTKDTCDFSDAVNSSISQLNSTISKLNSICWVPVPFVGAAIAHNEIDHIQNEVATKLYGGTCGLIPLFCH